MPDKTLKKNQRNYLYDSSEFRNNDEIAFLTKHKYKIIILYYTYMYGFYDLPQLNSKRPTVILLLSQCTHNRSVGYLLPIRSTIYTYPV